MHRRLAALLCVALATTGPAQQFEGAARSRTFGEARAADGSPWADAEVHFLHRAWTIEQAGEGLTDHVVVRSDERGRFGAQLVTGRDYKCWARSPAEDGTVLFSKQVQPTRAGERVELDAAPAPSRPTTIRVVGIEPEALAGLVATLHQPRVAGRDVPFERREDGTIVVPPTLSGSLTLRLSEPDGRPRLQAPVPADGGTHEVGTGGGQWARVRVFDLDQKAPIPNATIVWGDRGALSELATTGADGTAIVDLTFRNALVDGKSTRFGGTFPAVIADGWHIGMLMIDESKELRASREAVEADAVVDLECRPQRPPITGMHGRLLVGGAPAAGWPLLATSTAWHRDDESSSTGFGMTTLLRTGRDGGFELDGLSDGDEPFEIVFGETQLATLPEAWRRGLPSRVQVPLPRGSGEPVAIDLLEDFRVVDVQLIGDGPPADGVTIRVGAFGSHEGGEVRTDRTGRARLLLQTKDAKPLQLMARCDSGWAFVELAPTALADEKPDTPIDVRVPLSRMVRVKGTIARPEGAPAEQRVSISAYVDWGRMGRFVTATPLPADMPAWRVVPADEVRADQLGHMGTSVVARGNEFELLLPAVAANWTIQGWLHADGVGWQAQVPIVVDPDDEVVEVEVELLRQ